MHGICNQKSIYHTFKIAKYEKVLNEYHVRTTFSSTILFIYVHLFVHFQLSQEGLGILTEYLISENNS